MQVHQAGGLYFECLEQRHFDIPRIVETYPYEALSVCQQSCAPFCPARPSLACPSEIQHVARVAVTCHAVHGLRSRHARGAIPCKGTCLCSMLS